MRKAQTELLGLAIIIVLVTLAFGFVLVSTLRTDQGITTKKYLAEELPAETLSAMLRTSVQCEEQRAQISELIKNCQAESCECRNKNIQAILDFTYKDKGYEYEFETKDMSIKQGSCERKSYTSSKLTIPNYGQPIEVSLKLC